MTEDVYVKRVMAYFRKHMKEAFKETKERKNGEVVDV